MTAPLLEVVADGVQIYTCETKGSLFQWSFKAPEANLFDKQGRQIGTHFAGRTAGRIVRTSQREQSSRLSDAPPRCASGDAFRLAV